MTLSLAAVNGMDRDAFVAAFGDIFEHSPWIAAAAWASRPFAGRDALHAAMAAAVRQAGAADRLALLRAHPDLAGRAARAGTLTGSSAGEQAGAGLDRLDAGGLARFRALNDAYRTRFGFPFIIAVRGRDSAGILAAFEARLGNDPATEAETALAEVLRIARLRLDDLVAAP